MTDDDRPDGDFLAQASPELRELMASVSTMTSLDQGQVLFQQDDPGDTLYAVVSGRLEISLLSPDGRKLTLDVMGPGALIGEIALFDPGPRTATVTALEPSEVRGVRNADVLGALAKTPALHTDMIQLAGKRMRWMGVQLSEQVFLPMPAQIARKILHLLPQGGPDGNTLRMAQTDLGEFVGASRETVSKILSVWRRNGVIDIARGSVIVLDRDGLARIAENVAF